MSVLCEHLMSTMTRPVALWVRRKWSTNVVLMPLPLNKSTIHSNLTVSLSTAVHRTHRLRFTRSGRPMDITLVGGTGNSFQMDRVSSANGNGGGRNQRGGGFRNNNQRSNGSQNPGRNNRTRGGKQQNGAGNAKEDVTAENLDAELEAYRAESKQKKWSDQCSTISKYPCTHAICLEKERRKTLMLVFCSPVLFSDQFYTCFLRFLIWIRSCTLV